MSLEYHTSYEEQKKAIARAKVSQAAHDGSPPHLTFSQGDLEWAFSTEAEQRELARLEATAADIQRERREAEERTAAARELSALTDQILRDWDTEEKLARVKKAREEARRRLGLEG
jgi:hypothetical protein